MELFDTRPGQALVIGGTGGVGKATVKRLAAEGASVVFTYRSSQEAALTLIAECDEAGTTVSAVQLDIADSDACKAVITAAAADGLHTVVYAAGPKVPQTHLSRVSVKQFGDAVDAEVKGFFHIVHAALPFLRENNGSIVAVTSAATDRYAVRDGLSAGPKSAVEALVRGIAAEEGRFGVRANSVGPGMLHDGMAAELMAEGHYDQHALDVATNNIALRRFGSCDDVASAVCFLASDRAGYISGQSLNVDGGYTV